MEENNNYQDLVKKWHAKYAESYDHEVDNRFRILTKHVKPFHKVLNVGCGTGSDAFPLAHKCKHVTGIDICTEMITEAKKRNTHKNVTFQEADILKPPFIPETFHTAYSFSTMYYIKEQQKTLRMIHSLLKPKGTFIFDVGNKHSINNYWDRILFKVPVFNTTLKQVMEDVFDAGFKRIINIHHYQIHPWNRKEVFNQNLKPFAFRILLEVQKNE